MDLYALPPEEFTAARDAAAKEDKSLKALRKPTVSAWVVNTLVRRDAGLLDELLSLGADLGAAQQQGDAAALRSLGEQRRQLVGAVTQRAADLVDRDLTAAVRAEVESTLEAALADPASAEAVRSGQLVRALSFAGFGGVDLEGAVADLPRDLSDAGRARGHSGPDKSSKARESAAAKRVGDLEQAALEAAGLLDDAVQRAQVTGAALEDLEEQVAAAHADEASATERVGAARQALDDAEAALTEARHRRIVLDKEREPLARKAKAANKAVATAQEAADRARKALDSARRS